MPTSSRSVNVCLRAFAQGYVVGGRQPRHPPERDERCYALLAPAGDAVRGGIRVGRVLRGKVRVMHVFLRRVSIRSTAFVSMGLSSEISNIKACAATINTTALQNNDPS